MKVIKIKGTKESFITKSRYIKVIHYLQLDDGRIYEIQDDGKPKRKRLTRKTIIYKKLEATFKGRSDIVEYWNKHFSDMNVSEYMM